MTNSRIIPIVEAGHLVPDAGMLVLGYMLYPNCQRSAHQFARILSEETVAKTRDPDYVPSQILTKVLDARVVSRLLLAGQLALRVCANFEREGSADFNKAAYLVSSLNAANKDGRGKSLPSDERRLRATYSEYSASIHFWAAAYHRYPRENGSFITGSDVIAEMHISSEFLGEFLLAAAQFEEILSEAKPTDFAWSTTPSASEIWDFARMPKAKVLPETTLAAAKLSSYRSRPKS